MGSRNVRSPPRWPYQEVAAKTGAQPQDLADLYATPAREAVLIVIFKEAALGHEKKQEKLSATTAA
jgi:hypothetical protein